MAVRVALTVLGNNDHGSPALPPVAGAVLGVVVGVLLGAVPGGLVPAIVVDARAAVEGAGDPVFDAGGRARVPARLLTAAAAPSTAERPVAEKTPAVRK